MAKDPIKVVDWFKNNKPEAYGMSDYDIYEYAKTAYPSIKEELEEIGNPFSPNPPKALITTPKTSAEADYSPKKFETLTSAFNLADYLASEDEGQDPSAIKSALRLGMPKEYWQEAYNESMAGMLYSAANGEFKYDPEEYETGIMGEVGQFMAGLVNPIDAAMFVGAPLGGGMIGGKIASNQIQKWTAKGMANGVRKSIAGTPIARNIYNGILEQGIGFGAYSTAAGAIGSASQQATKQGAYADGDGTIDAWNLTKDATAAGAEGLLLGAVTGGTGKGIGHKFAGWRATTDGTSKALAKKVLNVGTQVGVEAAEFTAVPYLLHGMPMSPDGTIDREQVKHDLAHNVALIGTLKTVMNKGNILKAADADMKGFIKSVKGTIEGKLDPGGINAAKERVASNLKEQGGETSIIEQSINKANERLHKTKEGVTLASEQLTRLNELHEKVNNKTATEKEMAEFVTLASETMPAMEGFYTDILENEQLRKDLGIEDFNVIKKDIESRRDQIAEARETYNKVDGLNEAGGVILKGVSKGKPEITFEQKVDAMNENQLVSTYAKQRGISPQEARKELTLKSERGDIFDEQTAKDYIKSEKQDTQKLVEDVVKGVTGFDINESKTRAKKLVKEGDAKTRYDEFKDSVSENDALAIGEYALENSKYAKQVGKYLSWLKKNKGLEYKDSSKELVYEYLNDVVMASPNKNKIVGNDIAPFSTFDKFAKKKWVTDRKHEGLSFTEANEARFAPVVEREIPSNLLDNVRKNRKSATKDLTENYKNIKKDEVDFIYELAKRGIRPLELNKITPENFKLSEDGRYYIDFGAQKKSQSKFRLKILINEDIYNYAKNNLKKGALKRGINVGEKGKPKYKALQKLVAEKLMGDSKASIKDMRNALEQLKISLPEDILTQQQLDAYLGHLTGTDNKAIYKITGLPLKEQLDIARKVEKALNIVSDTKAKTKPKVESKKPLKINEVDTAEKSVQYWTEQKQRLKDRKQKDEGGQVGIQLAVSKELVELNKKIEASPEGKTKEKLMTQRAKLMKQLGLKDIKKRTEAQKIKGEVEFQGKDIQAERNKFIDEVLKKNNLTREQLKEAGLDANTLGEFGDGIIKLQRGEWQPADFYHENLHRLKAFAKKTGNKSLSKLIDKAEGLGRTSKEFKEWKKKNPNRDMEEFLADIVGGKASRINFTKGMMPKLKQFVKQLVSKVKTALGVGNFNDYSRVLAKKVQKGFDTSGTKFGKGVKKRIKEIDVQDTAEQAKGVKERFNVLLKDVRGKEPSEVSKYKNEFIQQIAKMAGVENPSLVTYRNLKSLSGNELSMINDVLSSARVEKARRQKNLVDWLNAVDKVEDFRLASNVNKSLQETVLKNLGVRNGDLTNANIKQIKTYKNYLKDLGFKEKNVAPNWIEEAYKFDFLNAEQKAQIEKFDTLTGEAKKAFLPLEDMVRSLGFNKLANKMFNHSSAESTYIGDLVTMEDNVARALGGGRSGKKAFEKNKDYFYLMDKERRLERIEQGILTKGEKSFIERAFDKEGNFTEAPEGKALTEISKWNKVVKERFLNALKENMTDAQYEKFISESNINWLDSKEYITRSLTEEFKKAFNVTGKQFRTLVNKKAKKIAAEIVDQEGIKNPEARNKRMIEVELEATEIARQYFLDRGNYTQTRISSRFLQDRGGKLSERVTLDNGKKGIEVYDTKYESTVRKYALGMAKYTANVEYFPEYIKIKGHKFKGVKGKEGEMNIGLLQGEQGGAKAESFLSKTIEKQLGVYKTGDGYGNITRIANDYASFLAKMQLSFPTSGLKNLLVGNYQTLGVVRLRDFARGFADIFSADIRRELRRTGATEVGLRNIDNNISIFGAGKKVNKVLDGIFSMGLMRPTENINRYIAVRASMHHQNHLVNTLQTRSPKSKGYINAENKLKKFYRMTDNEVAMLKEHGMQGASGMKAGVEAGNVSRRMEQVYQKMNTAAHIYTQGATLDLFLPQVFGEGMAKPLTLYKRMAYAATTNTVKNMHTSFTTGSPVRAFMPVAGSLLAGKALIEFYDKLLGQSPDLENGDFWDNLFNTLWKGEFGGMFSEIFNPKVSRQRDGNFLSPAIFGHSKMTVDTIMEIWNGQTGYMQGLETVFKGTAGFYNQSTKAYENTKLVPGEKTYNANFRKWRKLYSEFQSEIRPTKGETVIGKDERTPYFKDFLTAFNKKSEKEFAREYALTLIAVANGYYQEGYNTTGMRVRTLKQAFKEAQKTMDKKMKLLNPNKASLIGKKGISRKRTNQFRKWILDSGNKEQFKELETLEREYAFKVRSFKANKKKYFKELMIPDLMDDFNWD